MVQWLPWRLYEVRPKWFSWKRTSIFPVLGTSSAWAKRLKRVFHIDIETCSECGGAVKVIASIEDPVVIKKILAHLKEKVTPAGLGRLPNAGLHRNLACLSNAIQQTIGCHQTAVRHFSPGR